jgi:hypothetical protein
VSDLPPETPNATISHLFPSLQEAATAAAAPKEKKENPEKKASGRSTGRSSKANSAVDKTAAKVCREF